MKTCIGSVFKNTASLFRGRQFSFAKVVSAAFQTDLNPSFAKKKPIVVAKSEMVIKVLNVAEKNDAGKTIASLLSNNSSRRVTRLLQELIEFTFVCKNVIYTTSASTSFSEKSMLIKNTV